MITIAVEVLTCRQSESTAGSRQCRARAHRHHWGHGTGAHCSQDFLQRSQLHNCFLIVSYHFSLSLYLTCSYLIFTGSAVSTIHWGPQKIGSVFAAEPLVHLVDTNYPWQFLLLMTLELLTVPWRSIIRFPGSIICQSKRVTSMLLHSNFMQSCIPSNRMCPKNHLLKCIRKHSVTFDPTMSWRPDLSWHGVLSRWSRPVWNLSCIGKMQSFCTSFHFPLVALLKPNIGPSRRILFWSHFFGCWIFTTSGDCIPLRHYRSWVLHFGFCSPCLSRKTNWNVLSVWLCYALLA